MAQRPTRQKKDDRILHKGATANEIKADLALAPFDAAVREMDRKWGVDRLPELVSPETAQRFGSAMAKLNAAIDADDPEECLTRAKVVMRGFEAMDAEAEAAGAPKASPHVIEAEIDGWRFGILPDPQHWPAVAEARPDLTLFTMREIATLLRTAQMHHPMIEAAKKIGGAEIINIKPRLDAAFWERGDDLPPL